MGVLRPRAERVEQGKSLRETTPREAHASLRLAETRDPLALLRENDRGLLQELLPERYSRMAPDAFAFFRGGAALMAADLSNAPMAGIAVQACGDCHLLNFGAFNSPEENILFNVNDFDETLPGVDFTVDVKRLAASVAVAAHTAGKSRKQARAHAAAAVAAYRRHMLHLAELSPLEAWNNHIDLDKALVEIHDRGLRRSLRRMIAHARGEGPETDDNFPRLTGGGDMRILDKPPMIFHVDPSVVDPQQLFENYRAAVPPDRLSLLARYELRDLAFKAVGVGSVGTYCFIGLFASGDASPLFLQVKEARRSALEALNVTPYAGHQGRRVVEGQRVMQAATDIFLGWTEDADTRREFHIRRLKSHRLGGFADIAEGEALPDYSQLCGRTLARAHARSADPALIAGYMGKGAVFDDAIASFAMLYAAQTTADHAAFVNARAAGAFCA
jgi:uncharacterized protein (DUF2252 family)